VQELTREGVENDIDTLALSLTHDTVNKALVPGVENPRPMNPETVCQEFNLLFAADRNIDLSIDHLANLESGKTNTTTSTVMNQDRLGVAVNYRDVRLLAGCIYGLRHESY
jgi:hypothetical protein